MKIDVDWIYVYFGLKEISLLILVENQPIGQTSVLELFLIEGHGEESFGTYLFDECCEALEVKHWANDYLLRE